MALPSDSDIQYELMCLLLDAPNATMHCQDVFRPLAKRFPRLTFTELWIPAHDNGDTLWTNRVRRARQHMVESELLLKPEFGNGRGYWTVSAKGRKQHQELLALGASLLAEIEAMPTVR